jgi:hypothetical protein
LRSGDLFFASGDYLISQAIRTFTKSPWSHVGLIFMLPEFDRVLLLESVEDTGVRFAPVSKYLEDYKNGKPYDGYLVFARMNRVTPDWVVKMADFGCDELTRPYDEAEIAEIAARIALGIGRKQSGSHAYICSELVAACFKAAGYEFASRTPGFVTPEDIWIDDNVSFLTRVQ